MPTVLCKDCLGLVYGFLAKPHLETAIAHQIDVAARAGVKQDRQFAVWDAARTEKFTIRIVNDLWPARLGGGHRKLCVIILWHGPGWTPYDCTFHRRREPTSQPQVTWDMGSGLHEEIFEQYDGGQKGDLRKMVFEIPDLMQRFEQGKVAFIANQQYRAHHIGRSIKS